MSDNHPSPTPLPTSNEDHFRRFEAAWRNWRGGAPIPRWQEFLPAAEERCSSAFIHQFVQADIAGRLKAGLPALLSERYFEHPRLQQEDARLDAAAQIELIRWEYQQRWQKGDRAQRADYESAFPQHGDAVRQLQPRCHCPRCRTPVALDETAQTIRCPRCDLDGSHSRDVPLYEALLSQPADDLSGLDLRGYELIEQVGKGGMGAVYRAVDPALARDLAIKVMAAEIRGDAKHEWRFLREARVTGSLQHPGVVSVHNLGRLADGRLHYTMRLVRGRTFAAILQEEAGNPERLPSLLVIFEKICQTVAYAHSKRVIHRDLKPENVMVGKFGEVQVMDWGLAKLLGERGRVRAPCGVHGALTQPRSRGADAPPLASDTDIPNESAEEALRLSRLGRPMGTLMYMSPEQAWGEWDTIDERADVFALGSILCEMLTGHPAYTGRSREELERRVRRGDVGDALARLTECGADAALTALCRECLTAEREGRPRHAGIVAERVAAYETEMQARLRQAELDRVAAQTRAREEQARAVVEQEHAREALARAKAERRAKQRTLALAAAVLILVASGVAAVWRSQQERADAHSRREQAESDTLMELENARQRLHQGWQTQDLNQLHQAIAEAQSIVGIARGAGEQVRRQAEEFRTRAQTRRDRAEKNHRLLDALLDVAMPRETQTYRMAGSGRVMALPEPSVDEQYAAAFRRRWPDLDVDAQAAAVVAARLQQQPEAVGRGMIAGLDVWILARRRKGDEAGWRRLLALVERLDQNSARRQLRAIFHGPTPPHPASVVGLLAAPAPGPAFLWELSRGSNWRHLRQLSGQIEVADAPVLTVLLLAQARDAVGDAAGADEVLRQALSRRPDQVALLDARGKLLERQGRLAEAIGCYRAARARRPGLGVSLGRALCQAAHVEEGEAVLRDLLRQQPDNPEVIYLLANTLYTRRKYAETKAACRKALALYPGYARAFELLGFALYSEGNYTEAEAAYRKAIAMKPEFAASYVYLGEALYGQGKYAAAEAAYRTAIRLDSNFPRAYLRLGLALYVQRKYGPAEAAHREAIRRQPEFAPAYLNLGLALYAQAKFAEAEAAYRKAIALQPNDALAHNNLGNALRSQGKEGEAAMAYRKAAALKPDYDEAYSSLGTALFAQGKSAEAEAAYRKTIALKPKDALAYTNLGNALFAQEKAVEAEAAYRKALALQPEDATRYYNLGNALLAQRKFAQAETAFRKAIALQPEYALAHNNLSDALGSQGKFAEAEAAARKAIALRPDYAEAHCNLGEVMQWQGRFQESLTAFRRGHELGSKQPGWRFPTLQLVRKAERLVECEKKLPAILAGEAAPANPGEAVTLAWMCQQPYPQRYAASARLYADAFAAEPKLAGDLNQQYRYHAARSAALAAAGQGKDAHLLPDKVAVMFRRWALGWLRDDLTAYAKRVGQNNPTLKRTIRQRMIDWRSDADLTSVREPQALARLSAPERAAWHALWQNVDELAK